MNRSSWQAESSEVGDYKTIVKRPTSWIEMMSQQRRKSSKDLKPARRQGKASSKIKLTTSITEREVWSKVLRFRSFQIIQKMSIIRLSKLLRSTLSKFLRLVSHQSVKLVAGCCGDTDCHRPRKRTLYQTCLENEQPTNRCEMVSGSWLQRAQWSSCWRLWRIRLSAVQHLSCRASQPKNLHFPSALAFQRTLAPAIEDWPRKKAQ